MRIFTFILTFVFAVIQIAPAFGASGAVPEARERPVVNMRLSDAVGLALRNHMLVRVARERVSEADGVRLQKLSDLLPHLSATMFEQRTWHENLASLGFSASPLIPNPIIGPFNDFDARLLLTQRLLDVSAIYKSRAGFIGSDIARLEDEFARQKVSLAATLSYLDALRSFNNLKAAKADYGLARRLLSQARHQHEVGVANGVDVARAKTRAAQERLRVSQGKLFYDQANLELLRVTGLPFDTKLRLSDSLDFFQEQVAPASDAVSLAKTNRLEMQISGKNVEQAKYRVFESTTQYVPRFEAGVDYGYNGTQPRTAVHTGDGIIKASVPIFEGTLIQGEIQQASSQHRQAQIMLEDVSRQVEEDVNLALQRLLNGREKVRAARQVVILAQRELDMTNDRFASGIGDNIEVLNSQTALEGARSDYIAALTEYHIARVNLYSALGQVERFRLKNSI